LELRTVSYFLAVAESGSLRAAALKLGVSQPALTKAVQRLEDETGAPLFDRRSRGVSLTVYGHALLRHARNLRASLNDATDDIEALRAGIAGRVRVGAGPSWQGAVLPEAIGLFREACPSVRVHITGGNDDTLKSQLRGGSLDFVLAAIPDAPLERDLDRRPLLHDDYRVIASADHPLRRQKAVRLADLLAFPWIMPGPSTHMVERLRIIFRAHGLVAPEPVIETDIVRLKLALMQGAPYLSFHAEAHLAGLGAGRILPLDVPGTVWRRAAGIITRQGHEPNPAALRLVSIIERVCAMREPTAAAKATAAVRQVLAMADQGEEAC
jgi:DNA-binding transcriptional LysR family regulator